MQKDIEKKQIEMIERKTNSTKSNKNVWSTFKNINKDKKAWMLIKSLVVKILKKTAMISQKHCNFFVNDGNAKSSDVKI